MINPLISLWLLSALPVVFGKKIFRMIIYLGAYSLITSILFLVLGAPDVALAEASVSIFSTIFFITCFEKYYTLKEEPLPLRNWTRYILPVCFTVFLLVLFLNHAPQGAINTYSKVQYISYASQDVGGENVVGAILLGYRLYDTIFETLMLMMVALAISHLSWHKEDVAERRTKHIRLSGQAVTIIRLICPLLLVFGAYLIAYGHLSPGGGFQGGVILAVFFICRYMVHDIHDLPVHRMHTSEKYVFSILVLLGTVVVFSELHNYFPPGIAPLFQTIFLVAMNSLLGVKVALGFTMLFYRFITIERY